MSADDMIRRGDALASIENALNNATGDLYDAYAAIAALPAVTVGVPEATVYRAVLDWIRDDAGAAVKMSMTPDRANALTARILAALDLTPAPDAQVIEDARLGQEWDADDVEPCGKCMGSGYGGHPDSGALCTDCHGKGGIIRKPAPDAAAIREATARLHKLAYWLDTDAEVLAEMDDRDLSDHQHIQAEVKAILALIQKGGA